MSSYIYSSLQNKIWILLDQSTILMKFIYSKEGKLAKPTQVLPVRVRGPALIVKTDCRSSHCGDKIILCLISTLGFPILVRWHLYIGLTLIQIMGWCLHHTITWTNDDLLSIGPSATNFNVTQIKTWKFSFNKLHWKCCHTFCSGLNMLTHWGLVLPICISDMSHHWFK